MGKGDSKYGLEGHVGVRDIGRGEKIASTSRRSPGRRQDRKGSGGTYELGLRVALRRAKKDAEIAAQHGPVRQIVKDGKPV